MGLQQYHLNNANTKQTRELIKHIDKRLLKSILCDEIEALLNAAHNELMNENRVEFVQAQNERLDKIKEHYERNVL